MFLESRAPSYLQHSTNSEAYYYAIFHLWSFFSYSFLFLILQSKLFLLLSASKKLDEGILINLTVSFVLITIYFIWPRLYCFFCGFFLLIIELPKFLKLGSTLGPNLLIGTNHRPIKWVQDECMFVSACAKISIRAFFCKEVIKNSIFVFPACRKR